jgi:hypothetical protein
MALNPKSPMQSAESAAVPLEMVLFENPALAVYPCKTICGTKDSFTVQDWSSSSTPECYSSNHAMPAIAWCVDTCSRYMLT